jgi:hypothetical protein
MAQNLEHFSTEHTEDIVSFTPKRRSSQFFSEYCQQLIDHMEEGHTFESFAGLVRVSRQTLYNWCSLYPEFAEARDIGKEVCLLTHERHMLNTIRKGNFQMSIYMTKNLFPNDWRDKKDVEVQKEDTQKLTLDEQIQRVELMREQLLQLKAGTNG